MIERVQQYMAEEGMLTDGQHIILGVSGGADSMCLLFIMHAISAKLNLTLTVVHINHGIRGAEADADEAFVGRVCQEKQVLFRSFHMDIPSYARQLKCSEEEAGRLYRYQCFEEVRDSVGGDRIAVAHNSDDVSETVLLNIFRGTGIKGLSGIPARRGCIIRPLLCISRSEIEAFVDKYRIPYRTDRTNFETDYVRNKIRLDVLPYVEDNINAQVRNHLRRLSEMAGQVQQYMEEQAQYRLDDIAAGSGTIDVRKFSELPPVLGRELLRMVIEKKAGKLKDINYGHIDAVAGLMHKQVGKMIHLPYGLTAIRQYHTIEIENKHDAMNRENRSFVNKPRPVVDLEPDGSYESEDYGITLELRVRTWTKNETIPQNSYTKWFDYDKIKVGLKLRTRQSGDYMVINQQGNKKPMNRVMIDDKVPQQQRDILPLIADGSHILWMPGGRISETFKVTEQTEKILVVKIKEKEKHGR